MVSFLLSDVAEQEGFCWNLYTKKEAFQPPIVKIICF